MCPLYNIIYPFSAAYFTALRPMDKDKGIVYFASNF